MFFILSFKKLKKTIQKCLVFSHGTKFIIKRINAVYYLDTINKALSNILLKTIIYLLNINNFEQKLI